MTPPHTTTCAKNIKREWFSYLFGDCNEQNNSQSEKVHFKKKKSLIKVFNSFHNAFVTKDAYECFPKTPK